MSHIDALQSSDTCPLGEEMDSRSRTEVRSDPRVPAISDPIPSDNVRMREASLSASPFLFPSSAAWVVMDFTLVLMVATYFGADRSIYQKSIHSLRQCAVAGLPFVVFVILWSHLSGLYRVHANHAWMLDLFRILRAVSFAGLGLYGIHRLWATTLLTPGPIAIEAAFAGSAMFSGRMLWRRYRDSLYRRNISLRNFLIVGADEVGRDVRLYLESMRLSGYSFKGFVSMSEHTDDERIVGSDDIVGDIHHVLEVARSKFVDEIIFSRRPATPGVLSGVLRQARSMGISIRLIPSLTETLIDRTDVHYVGDLPTIVVFQAKQHRIPLLLKRAFDLVFATLGCVTLLPLFVVIALVIKLQSRGPVLYISNRVDHKGRVFTCYKFRTMTNNAERMQSQLAHLNERDGVLFKISKDPRITTVGAFLRKYSLDELPQLWNVIRGDMSLVGPRPPISSEVAQYEMGHLRRLDAVPGITGLWQVEARQDPSFDSYVSLDRTYVNHWSLLLDMRILFRTVRAVIRGTGS